MAVKILAILGAILLSSDVICENILFLYPMASPSHKNVAVPLMLGLADRGHNVTVVSSFKTEEHKNVRDTLVHKNFEYFPGMNALDMRRRGPLGMLSMNDTHFIEYCHATYRNTEFMRLLNESFDLVYMDAFANDCLLGFIHKLGAPFIVISPLPVPGEISMYTGNRLPLSFVPHWLVPFGHRMTFLERIVNVFISTLSTVGMADGMRNNERVYREELGQDLPGGYEIAGNVSMILVNSHFSFNFPRPTLPDVVEIGAIHCRPGKALPEDLEKFLTGAEHGFILFSLGSIVRPHEMPDKTRKVFVNVFSRLKQRVLWKWPKEMPDLPSNVKLSKWIPQQDVLAHPNIRLFISHGGLLSTQESIYHGVPMVDIPVFGDQDLNANRAAEAGFSITVEILDITEEVLENAIYKVMNESRFRDRVKAMSAFIKDQPETPKERAIFWSEYVMRNKGARHLRSAARELNIVQYYCLDVVVVLASLVTLMFFIVFVILRKAVNFLGKVVRSLSAVKPKTL